MQLYLFLFVTLFSISMKFTWFYIHAVNSGILIQRIRPLILISLDHLKQWIFKSMITMITLQFNEAWPNYRVHWPEESNKEFEIRKQIRLRKIILKESLLSLPVPFWEKKNIRIFLLEWFFVVEYSCNREIVIQIRVCGFVWSAFL